MQTVLLVRHADIDLPPLSADPPLNAAGQVRAVALAHVAGGAGVVTVFTSTLLRTKQTAAPLTALLGLQPRVVPPPSILAQEVLSGTAGEVILIAGHSNTVPAMITALGAGVLAAPIGEGEFDNLFVVTVTGAGQARVVRLRYGEPSV